MKTKEFSDLFFVLQDAFDCNKELMPDAILSGDIESLSSHTNDCDSQFVVNY
jgi:hypothetical protein